MTTEDTSKTSFIDFMVTSAAQTIIKSEFETNNNTTVSTACSTNGSDGLRCPSDFSIEYWNNPSALGLNMEKDDPHLWDATLLDDMNFFNAKMTNDLDQHPESSTSEACDTSETNIIYTTLTSLSNDPSSPSISLEDTSVNSTSTPSDPMSTWYHPPVSISTSGGGSQQDASPTISTASSTTPALDGKVPNIEDLDRYLNIIPATSSQNYTNTYSDSSGYEWKQDSGDPGGSLCEASNLCEPSGTICEAGTLWKQPTEDNDSLLRNALEGKSVFKYNNNNNNNEFVLTIKEENAGNISNLVLDNQNISTIIYPIDSNSSQSIDEILQNINTHYETSVDEFNNNNTEYNKVNGESIEIYYAIDNNINVNYIPNNTITSSVPGSTVKKKKTKNKNNNHTNHNNNELINGKKERSLHYCEICNKGFKDKYSKAHLAKHFQTHLAPATHTTKSSNSGVNSSNSNKIKIMKT
ncbi:hypothetical protein M8J75_007434 [Diaphorina citri]|nr:hypothetical protein M8J75_007434 [Diaphorina citri]